METLDCNNSITVGNVCRNNICSFSEPIFEGEACDYDHECDEGLCCLDGICLATPSPLSGSCETNQDCEDGLTCFDMTCMDIPLSNPGNFCTESRECANGSSDRTFECRNMMCSTIPAVASGDVCSHGFECD